MAGIDGCQGLSFRLADVDGFFHPPVPDPESPPETVVFFKGYTYAVPDPDKRLHTYLKENTDLHAR